jgi:hypothetical protein
MAVISVKSFGGISPRTPARYLQEGQAQTALNSSVFNGSIQPLLGLSDTLLTLTKNGTVRTIYRFGQNEDSDTQYWFHWIDDVDVCRSQIAGDISEWTFFTGDGAPKATYNTIALSAAPYPGVARKLGLPNPTNALSVSLGPYAPADTAAIVYLYPSQIDQITAGANAIEYSIDNEQTFTGINITSGNETVAGVVAAITALTPPSGISAVVETFDQNEVLQAVKVTSTATGASANLTIRIEIANAPDKTSAFSYSGYDSGAKTGSSNTISSYLITDTEIGSAEIGHQMDLSVKINTSSTFCNTVILNTGANTAADLAKSFMFGQIILDATEITAFIAGQYLQFGQGVTLVSTVTSVGGYTADTLATAINSGRVDPGSGFVIFAGAFDGKVYINAIAPAISEISWTRYSGDPADPGTTTENSGLSSKMPESGGNPYVDVVAYGSIIFVTPNSIGTGSTDETTYARYNAPAGTPNRAALTQAFIANSEAASPAKVIINQDDIDAVEGSFVSILTNDGENIVLVPNPSTVNSLFGLVGGSVNINIYGNASPVAVITSVATGVLATLRIQEGSYASTVNDYITIKAGGGTEEPSATESRSYVFTWVNKESGFEFESGPSGASDIVDVHVGQDVTISGFSTIASGYAATNLRIYRTVRTGTPYFIQGSSPDSTVVVKSDLEQACVSKRSIVSTNGVVVYASPDGLIMLTPGGSQMITEKYFNRAQWQTYFQPTSIHAYSHDMKYIAFYEIENGDGTTTQGGFIYDFKSQQFILHNLYASAGYADLQQDQLFVVTNNRLLKKWEQGSALSYIWKSKKFTMPYPIGFTCAQVEAETYPVTCKIYQAGTLIHTQTVASREPFRLPSNVGRDWEIQLEGTSEVFSLDLAQSMGELGGV